MRVRVPSSRRGRAAAVCLLVAGVVALSLSPVPRAFPSFLPHVNAASQVDIASSSNSSWNNGKIALTLVGSYPSFTVASLANQSASANQALTGLAEVNATDAILSFASFSASGVHWNLSSSSTPQGTDVTMTARVPVRASGGEWESGDASGLDSNKIGTTNVTITFALNASSSGNPWSVSYTLNVTGWPWLYAADAVGVEVRSNATSSSTYWAPGGTNRLTELTKLDHVPLASFVWGATAVAQYTGGTSQNTSVGTYSNLSSGGASFLVRLEFGSVTGGYTSLSYDPWLAIVPSFGSLGKVAAWVLTPTSLAIIAGGAGGALVLAVLARSRRTPPESGL